MFGTQEQFASTLRTIAQVAGGVLATYGYMSAGTWEVISGAVITLVAYAYSMYLKRAVGVVATAAAVPGVVIQAPAKIADAVNVDNVVRN